MSPRSRKTRGASRLAGLLVALGLAALLAWWMSRPHSATSREEVPAVTAPAVTPGGPNAQPWPAVAPAGGPAPVNVPAGMADRPGAEEGPAASAGAPPQLPRHWQRCLRDPASAGDYLVESDSSTAWSGSASVRVSSRVVSPRSPGAGVCQTFAADSIRGRRIRISLHMRTLDARPGAHMTFRAEGADGRVLAFHNMEPRWIRGNSDWAEYSAVLDVPAQVAIVLFGATLENTGTLWVDDALIQVVGADAGVTQAPTTVVHFNPVTDTSSLARALRNPGFEDTWPGGTGP